MWYCTMSTLKDKFVYFAYSNYYLFLQLYLFANDLDLPQI
jgi:hypothetical protein